MRTQAASTRPLPLSAATRAPSGAPERPDASRVAPWALLALVAAILLSLGSTLLGLRVFSASDLILQYPPWRAELPSGVEASNYLVSDTVDSVLPMRAELRRHVLAGDYPLWTGLPSGGTALGAVPHIGPLSPLTLPYLVLPLHLAPAAAKLAQMAIAAGFTYLFLRRASLGPAAALIGALAFVNSGFQVVWTNWPQSNVGALIPALFWAVERALATRRTGAFLPVTVVMALMLLEGFPAVTLVALIAVGAYALVRLALLARAGAGLGAGLAALAGLGVAVVGGVLLAAVQLLPFLSQLAAIDLDGRADRYLGKSLPLNALVTTVVPGAFGSPTEDLYVGVENYVETSSFIGVVSAILVLAALTGRARQRPARGVLGYLVGAAATLVVLIYVGGPLLDALQRVPPFGINFIGRQRAVLGFLLACLAAIGFQRLLAPQRRPGDRARAVLLGAVAVALVALAAPGVWEAALEEDAASYLLAQLALPGAVGVAALAAVAWHATRGRPWHRAALLTLLVAVAVGVATVFGLEGVRRLPELAEDRARVTKVLRQALVPAAFAATTFLGAVVLRGRDPRTRLALLALPLLLATESMTFARAFWPRIPVEEFYPLTDTHRFLAEESGHERILAEELVLFPGTTTFYGLRMVTGHVFADPDWREALLAVDDSAYHRSATFSTLRHSVEHATSPLLDRFATRFYVAGPDAPLFGERVPAEPPARRIALSPGVAAQAPLEGGEVRAVTLLIAEPYEGPDFTTARVDLLDADGALLTSGERRLRPGTPPGPFDVPVVQPQAPAAPPAAARVHLDTGDEDARSAALVLEADEAGHPLLPPVLDPGDGLRTAAVGGAVVYERLDALPRFRWAPRRVVIPAPGERLRRLAEGVDPGTVVLSGQAPEGSGRDARVEVRRDGPDELVVGVDADGDGYLVVADALREGWSATVEGQEVPLLAADHAVAAVHVPQGRHEVRLAYSPPGWRTGLLVSTSTLGVLVALAAWAALAARRRRRGRAGRPPGA